MTNETNQSALSAEELEAEINHIIESGANKIRYMDLFKRYAPHQIQEVERLKLQNEEEKIKFTQVLLEWDDKIKSLESRLSERNEDGQKQEQVIIQQRNQIEAMLKRCQDAESQLSEAKEQHDKLDLLAQSYFTEKNKANRLLTESQQRESKLVEALEQVRADIMEEGFINAEDIINEALTNHKSKGE